MNGKRPCPRCNELVMHYPNGDLERHKEYVYKEVRGKTVKTKTSFYCPQKRWFD